GGGRGGGRAGWGSGGRHRAMIDDACGQLERRVAETPHGGREWAGEVLRGGNLGISISDFGLVGRPRQSEPSSIRNRKSGIRNQPSPAAAASRSESIASGRPLAPWRGLTVPSLFHERSQRGSLRRSWMRISAAAGSVETRLMPSRSAR